MRRAISLALFLSCATLQAEPRSLTLKQAVDLAQQQSPELLLARLDAQKAELEVTAVKEPLLPRVIVGSGLAYSNGMPMSIEGSSPSVVQAKAIRTLWNRPQAHMTSMARADAKAAGLSADAMREEVALRTAVLFLDLERAARLAETAAKQVEILGRIEAAVSARVGEGRELGIEEKRAKVKVARARQQLALFQGSQRTSAAALARVLGLSAAEEIVPAMEERPEPMLPESEDASVETAIKESVELRRMESSLAAKRFQAKSFKSMRLPKVDLVAQYGLLAKFNNYEDFFNRFQQHNGQLGISIAVPVFASAADEARASQSLIEARRIEVEMRDTRGRIESETKRAWQDVRDAEMGRDVSRMDLEVARDQVSLLLAKNEEGRASLVQLEEARYGEHERWRAYFEARYEVERARLALLKQANRLTAVLN